MRKIIVAVLLSIALLLAANWQSVWADLQAVSTPQQVTTHRDKYQTDLFTGSATYSYPISVPKGTNDLTPDVTLSYDNQGAHSLSSSIGSGWEVSKDYIQRIDNFTPTNTSDDTYQLHFKGVTYDLVYNPVDSLFHTKVESFLKIQQYLTGGQGTTGMYWQVTTTDGTVYRFGYSLNSELLCNGQNYDGYWNIDQVTDTHNNHIYYTYSQSSGMAYLTQIQYNTEKLREIDFNYLTNPYQFQVYQQGCNTTDSSRLSSVLVKANGNLVHEYDVAFGQAANGQNLLSTITEKGSDASALPPTSFNYNSEPTAWNTSPATWVSGQFTCGGSVVDISSNNTKLLDVNGDGLTDIVYSKSTGSGQEEYCVFVNNGNGWNNTPQIWVNGQFTGGSVAADLGNANTKIADVNNDGLPDIILSYFNGNGESYYVFKNTGSSWNPTPEVWVNGQFTGGGTGADLSQNNVRLIDVNGDGLPDVVLSQSQAGGVEQYYVFKNTGSSWNPTPEVWVNGPFVGGGTSADITQSNMTFADVNGDGLPDVVLGFFNGNGESYYVFKNTGSSWNPTPEVWVNGPFTCDGTGADPSQKNIRIIDANGDGLPDIVLAKNIAPGQEEYCVFINTGSSWNPTPQVWVKGLMTDGNGNVPDLSQTNTQLIDANGDGLPDVVLSINGGATNESYYVYKNNGYAPDTLSTITTEQGGTVHFDYTASTKYVNGNKLPFPLWVVSKQTLNNGVSNSQGTNDVTTYSYQNGAYNFPAREFRGFGQITQTDPNGAQVQYIYNQDDAEKGLVASVTTNDSSGNPYAKKENTWTSTLSNSIYTVVLSSEKNYTYDGVLASPKITETDYQYDTYGNQTKISELGDTSITGDERFTYNEYIYNPALWIVNKVSHAYRNGADDLTKVSETWNFYDSDTSGIPSPTPTPTPTTVLSPTPTPTTDPRFGNGTDGDLVITSDTTESPIDSSVTATSGSTVATVGSGLGFAANQIVLFHQTQGANAGVWEMATIQSYSGTTLTLTSPLTNSYSSTNGNLAQVRVVPQYHNVTVNAGATWSVKPWNGTTGGIMAFLANGTVAVNGAINGSGKGFRGGQLWSNAAPGWTGEGQVGPSIQSGNANGNGGGGGTQRQNFDGQGAGGGGNGTAGGNGGQNDSGQVPGQGGGTSGSADLTSMTFGGGGGTGLGAGQTTGGTGGGIILINGATVSVNGPVTVNGITPPNPTDQGGSGGGAGGSLRILSQNVTLGTNFVTASHGNGAQGTKNVGGAGGDGRVRIDYGSLTGTTSPSPFLNQDPTLVAPTPTPTPVPPADFGNGSDGDITIASNTTDAPVDASVNVTAGSTSVGVGSQILGFATNQLVLFHQTRGTNAGTWELARIQSYTGNTLTLTAPLVHSYSSTNGDQAQVRLVPQYHNVTVNAGATWNVKPWNGTTGGIMAFLANGTITINGTIAANGAGFRGGPGRNGAGAGYQGEGTLGIGTISQLSNGNGGGGGGDYENPSAGGGNGTTGGNPFPGSTPNGGIVVGTANLTTMDLGGAGGGVGYAQASPIAASGGNGSGIVFLSGANLLVNGAINVNGSNGNVSPSTVGSGGGAGGSILFNVQTATLGANLISALGGSGGVGTNNTGGYGGNGRIHVNYITSYSGTTNPTIDSSHIATFTLPAPAIVNTPSTLTQGDLTRQIKWNNSGANPVTTYTYDSFGNQISVTDANNHTTQYVFGITDSTNTYPERIIDANNKATNYSYDLGTGNILSKTDPNGYISRYSYDVFGRLSSETDPYDSTMFPTVSYQYFDTTSPQGKLVSRRTTAGTSNTLNTYTFVDGFGRTLQMRSDAEDTTKQIVTDVFYNAMGLVSSQTIPHLDGVSTIYAAPLSGTKTITSTYDVLGRLTVLTHPDLTQKQLSYNHGIKTITDENGHTLTDVYNPYGKIIEVDEESANGTGLPYTTLYTYDPRDLLTKIVDFASNTATFTYDSVGNKLVQKDPDLGTWNFTYDGVGNLLAQTDSKSIQTTRTYDNLNRLTKVHFPTDPDIVYTYDTNTIGTLANVTDHAGTVSYVYDQRLRKTQETRIADGNTWTTAYNYDSADRMTSQTNPDGETITYSFNPQGTISGVSGVFSNIDYNAQGNVIDKSFTNGLTTNYSYDPNSFRLSRIQTGTLQDLSYSYDGVGNVKSITDNKTNVTQTFTYDYLNRLTNASASDGSYTNTYTYTYDPLGNILQFSNGLNQITYTYGQQAGPHAVTTASSISLITPTPVPPTATLSLSPASGTAPVSITANASGSTPGTNPISTYTFTFGDGTTVGPQTGSTASHTYTMYGSFTVTATVIDSIGDSNSATQSLSINAAPSANAGGPYAVNEGSSIVLTGSGTDPDGDTLTYAWDLDNNGTYETAGQTVTFQGIDGPATKTVGFEVCDSHSACSTTTTTITIANVSPIVGTLNVSPSQPQTNTQTTVGASFTDAGILDTHTATIDYGDGTGAQNGAVTEANGSGTASGSHTYTTTGNYTITVTLTDKDGASTLQTAQIFVNAPPVPNANGPYTFTEGSTGLLTGSATDADNDTLTYSWDLNNDGVFDVTGQNTPFSAVDGPATQTVVLKVCDTHNACATSTTTVTVTNVTPTVGGLSVSPSQIVINSPTSVSASFTDAGILDTHTATIDYGDGTASQTGTVSEANGSGTVTGSHTYTTSGTYTIVVTVTDKDGGVGFQTKQVIVNTPPAAALSVSPASGIVPFTITANASGSTPGTNPISTYTFTFGDGTTVGPQSSSSATHAYTVVGTYTVSVTVTDSIGLTSTKTQSVTVNPAPPTAALSVSPSLVTVPAYATASAGGSTAGTNPISTYTFTFGDGTTVGPQTGSSATHLYNNPGTYTVTVTVTDTIGLIGTTTQSVTMAPILTLSNVSSGTPTASGATITWTTNAGGTGQVIFGTTSGNLTSSSSLITTLTTSHSISLTGLTKNKTYYYKVLSKNAANSQYSSTQFSFTTPSH